MRRMMMVLHTDTKIERQERKSRWEVVSEEERRTGQ